MKMTKKEVQHVAFLARIEIDEAEQEKLTAELDSILGHMERLNEIETQDVEPLAHVVDVVNAFREDDVVNQPRTEELLANAPARDDDFLSVPKIIE